MEKSFVLALALSSVMMTTPALANEGETIFQICHSCHDKQAGDAKKFGPHLGKILGRSCGSVDGYEYSKGYLKACNASKIIWSEEEILSYLDNPTKFLKSKGGGRSKMSFMLKDSEKRKAVVELLKSF